MKHRGEANRLALTGRYHLNQPLETKYSLENKNLGTGMNGPVRLAKGKAGGDLEKRSFAVKALSKKLSTDMEKVKREVRIYLNIDHPNIARLVDVFDTNSTLYLVMECLEGGELFDRIAQGGAYAEGKAVDACKEMFAAVAYLHQQEPPIVHRDLKPENFMYDKKGSGHLKLIDFGLSMFWDRQANHKMSDACGTLGYMAPECLRRQPYTEKCDIFSLGVIAYILLTGHPPFLQANRMDEYKPFKQRTFARLSEGARKFVRILLDVDAVNRPTAVSAMQDPWMKNDQGLQDAAIDVEVLRSMQRYCSASQFRRACLSMVAWSLTSDDRRQLENTFLELDKNKDGRISLSEVKTVLEDSYCINSEDFVALFSRLEGGSEHEICYSEFLAAAMQERVRMHEYALSAAFSRFDQRNKGYITNDDLKAMLSLEGVSAEELLREVDIQGTGRITRQAFLDYLLAEDDSSDEESAVAATPVTDSEDSGRRAQRRSSRRELAALVIDGEREREVLEKVAPRPYYSFSPTSTRIVGPNPLQRRAKKPIPHKTWG